MSCCKLPSIYFATWLFVRNSVSERTAWRKPGWLSAKNLHFHLCKCKRRQCGVDKIHCAALIQSQSDSAPKGGNECSTNSRCDAQWHRCSSSSEQQKKAKSLIFTFFYPRKFSASKSQASQPRLDTFRAKLGSSELVILIAFSEFGRATTDKGCYFQRLAKLQRFFGSPYNCIATAIIIIIILFHSLRSLHAYFSHLFTGSFFLNDIFLFIFSFFSVCWDFLWQRAKQPWRLNWTELWRCVRFTAPNGNACKWSWWKKKKNTESSEINWCWCWRDTQSSLKHLQTHNQQRGGTWPALQASSVLTDTNTNAPSTNIQVHFFLSTRSSPGARHTHTLCVVCVHLQMSVRHPTKRLLFIVEGYKHRATCTCLQERFSSRGKWTVRVSWRNLVTHFLFLQLHVTLNHSRT